MDNDARPTVLVTGFGPFGMHKVNASWEAVKLLTELPIENCPNIKLVAKEIPVAYDDVCNQTQQLWKEYNPMLVMHVGVSHKADCLTIESRAQSTGYRRPDVCNKQRNECGITPFVKETGIDIVKICEKVNENSHNNGWQACVSQDAGRYLCEYIFLQSLCIEASRTLFVHVPDFHVYSSMQTAKGLADILRYAIEFIQTDVDNS